MKISFLFNRQQGLQPLSGLDGGSKFKTIETVY